MGDDVDEIFPVFRHGLNWLFVEFGVGLMARLFLTKERLEVTSCVVILRIVLGVRLIVLIVGLGIVLIVGLVVGLCEVWSIVAADESVRDLTSSHVGIVEIVIVGI